MADLSEIKKFVANNDIVGTSAGVCIALATKDCIESLVGDIIMPLAVIVLHLLRVDALAKFLPVKGAVQLNVADFVKQLITFILIIVISYIFVRFAFGYLLGVDTTKKSEKGEPKGNETFVAF
jgi:large-conductance mechanosensitive channel